MFLIKSLKLNFNIGQYISFISSNTRSGDHQKFVHPRTTSVLHHHFYFNCIARLQNFLPVINLTLPAHIVKHRINHIFGNISLATLIQIRHALFTYCVHVTDAQDSPSQLI